MKGMHGIIFSYERRNDLRELTEVRAPASVPFGGRYRVIDFALSNMVNAGITDVGVVLHGRYQSLLDHLGTGKNWDLSRKRGGLTLLPPYADKPRWEDRRFRGKMDALMGIRSYLDEIRQDYVVLTDGDLVINLDLEQVYEAHLRTGADITVVCANDSFSVSDGTFFEVDGEGRVTDTIYHTRQPRGHRGLETYLLSKELLVQLTDECGSHDQDSFRRDVLQARSGELDIRAFIWGEYAAQIRTVQDYYDRSMQLLDPAVRRELFCPQRPIRAKSSDEASTYMDPQGHCVNAVIGDGSCIEGTVEDSILFPGVVVERGAEVRGCILMKDTVVRRGSRLQYVVADKNVEILEGRTLMGHAGYPLVIAKGSRI